MRLCFLTATPLQIAGGSGTFVGLATLADSLRALGHSVEILSPRHRLPVFTAERLLFNRSLQRKDFSAFDAVCGFDMDGYRIAGTTGVPHVAAIKGIIADEMQHENGFTRATMALQARCESKHVRRADLVITTSRYAAERLQELYGIRTPPGIVPELIDLPKWRELFQANPASPDPGRFTVLCVCRFYKRKRLPLLLRAAAYLRARIPGLEVRIVGGGPEQEAVQRLWYELRLAGTVNLLGDVSRSRLAQEYNGCDLFCLPSVQEGFGIVFLEAMAAGKPIVAARAAAVPETVTQGLLVQPESWKSLAEGIETLYRNEALRTSLAAAGARRVQEFDAQRVAALYGAELESLGLHDRAASA